MKMKHYLFAAVALLWALIVLTAGFSGVTLAKYTALAKSQGEQGQAEGRCCRTAMA